MGACLAKSDKLSTRKQSSPPPPPGHAELPPLSSQAGIRTKNITDDDGLAVPNVEYPRTRTFYDKVLKRDSDKASAKLMRGSSSRQNGRVSNSDMRLQGMSSAELVEQYSLDASQLMDSVARLERLVLSNPTASHLTDEQHTHDQLSTARGALPANHIHASSLASGQISSHDPSFAGLYRSPNPVEEVPTPTIDSMLTKDPRIAAIARDYSNGRMLAAMKELSSWCLGHSLQLSDLETHHNILGFKASELVAHCDKIKMCLDLMEDESGYSTSRDDGDLKVLYKCLKGKEHHVKMESTLCHPLERPLSLAREFDLMNSWNHYIEESQMLLAPSIWQSYVYATLWMPFPFPTMECLGTGRGYDLSREDKSLLVAIESIDEADLPHEAAPIANKNKKKRHRADVLPGSCIRFEALPPAADGTPRTKGTILQIVDPHVPHVPGFIVSFVLKVLAPFAHKQIAKLLKDEFDSPSKPFPRRLAANPQLYDRVREVVKEGLAFHYGVGTVPMIGTDIGTA